MLSSQEEQAERRRVLAQDASVRQQQREQGASFHQFAEADAAIPLGRFTQDNAATVIGSTALPQYPAAAAHQHDPVPIKPPTGYRIDAMPEHEPLEQFSSFLPAQATDPTSEDAPSPIPLSDVQRTGVGSLSNKAYRRF
jgi:hypothetical protein